MAKILISIVVILLFVAALITYRWPDDFIGIISTVGLIIFSIAAGIAVTSFFKKKDKEKENGKQK